ncbi:MAG: cation diffusion facilitator family transporter [Actinomycetaceae bacterium]|nr:cation diffusion facilitator family transporter [Actinomycetaceae bacterium]
MGNVNLSRYAWLSVAAAVVTIALKTGVFLLTGSVGFLSDAAESAVNLVAAIVALLALRQAAKPADTRFSYGRTKAEYFSSTVEGTLIFVAAGFILVSAVRRIIRPEQLDHLGPGIAVAALASVVNGAVALILLRAGRSHHSPALVADAKHLLTDVATSVGVIVGVGLVFVTGWQVLDPIVALLVGLNILVTGVLMVRQSLAGLMDVTLPDEQNKAVIDVLEKYRCGQIQFHGLQTRASGRHSFANVHMLVPGTWSVDRGHALAHEVEQAMAEAVPGLQASIHVEPIEDPSSYEDIPTGSLPLPPAP